MRKFTKIELGSQQSNCLKRIKSSRGQCCCNCVHHVPIFGHPWITNTSITTPTGLYACTVLTDKMKNGHEGVISYKHGLCEMWEPK